MIFPANSGLQTEKLFDPKICFAIITQSLSLCGGSHRLLGSKHPLHQHFLIGAKKGWLSFHDKEHHTISVILKGILVNHASGAKSTLNCYFSGMHGQLMIGRWLFCSPNLEILLINVATRVEMSFIGENYFVMKISVTSSFNKLSSRSMVNRLQFSRQLDLVDFFWERPG